MISNINQAASEQTNSITSNQPETKLPYGLERPVPKHWGTPPEIQTCDWVKLPAGFGSGSSTLKNWIAENMKNDAPGAEKQ